MRKICLLIVLLVAVFSGNQIKSQASMVYDADLPDEEDTIIYQKSNIKAEFINSLYHRGFDSLELVYEQNKYMWYTFFDEPEYTLYTSIKTVALKGKNIYEEEIVNEYEKYYRFYKEERKVFYEVQDLVMGNFTDPNGERTKKRIGNACSYFAFDPLTAPTYNPLILGKNEEISDCFVTKINQEPCLFMETRAEEKTLKKWISIHDGVLVKQQTFDEDGRLTSEKILTSIEKKEIDDQTFNEPNIDYQDLTLLIYSLGGGDLGTLIDAVYATISEDETGILLVNKDESIALYTRGMEESIPKDVLYLTQNSRRNKDRITLREFKRDKYYTICDELRTAEIYGSSFREKKFFNFQDVGLLGVHSDETGKRYLFYDANTPSVSGMMTVYAYNISDKIIRSIDVYQVEGLNDRQPVGEIRSYSVERIPFDEEVYDESFLKTYKIIDHGEDSVNDGEHIPFWYE